MRILAFHCQRLTMSDRARSSRPADPAPEVRREHEVGSVLGAWVCVEPDDGAFDVARAASHLRLCQSETADPRAATWIIPFVHLSRDVEPNFASAKSTLSDLAAAMGPDAKRVTFGFHKVFAAERLRFVWPHAYRGAPVFATRGLCTQPAVDLLLLRAKVDGQLRLLVLPWICGTPDLADYLTLVTSAAAEVRAYSAQFLPSGTPVDVQWFDHATLELAHALAVQLQARATSAPVAHGSSCCHGAHPWLTLNISPTVGAAVFRRATVTSQDNQKQEALGAPHDKLVL